MVSWLALLAGLSALAWLYLLVGHGRFRLCSERLPAAPIAEPAQRPSVAAALAAGASLLMMAAHLPKVRYYRQPAASALTLPLAALLYLGMTLDSARRHWWGSGSRWKGRDYGMRA